MRIVIHNFGPIKEADIETKRYTVFIGQTSTGKSVAAKLISIANDPDFMMLENGDFKGLVGFLAKYSIDFPFNKDTEIRIRHNDNILLAFDVYSKAKRKGDGQKMESIAKHFSPDGLVCFDDIAAYSFDGNGIVTYINDSEMRSTGAYALDTASAETANVYNELLAIDRSAEGRFQGKNEL